MKPKGWLIFLGVQAAGIAAVHVGPQWLLIVGIVVLLPGMPLIYLSLGLHQLIALGDVPPTIAGVLVNAAVWEGAAVLIRKYRKRVSPGPAVAD